MSDLGRVSFPCANPSTYNAAVGRTLSGQPLMDEHALAVALVWRSHASQEFMALCGRTKSVEVPVVLADLRRMLGSCEDPTDRRVLHALVDYVLDRRRVVSSV